MNILSYQNRDVQTRTAQLFVLAAFGTSVVAITPRASRRKHGIRRESLDAPLQAALRAVAIRGIIETVALKLRSVTCLFALPNSRSTRRNEQAR